VLDRVPGEDVVEVHPGAHEAVGRELRRVGPVELQPVAAADDPQALVLDPSVVFGRGHPQGDELADRPRRQAVAADLLAGEGGLLQQQDVEPRHGQVCRRRRAAGAGTDDDDVGSARDGLGGLQAVQGGVGRRRVGRRGRVPDHVHGAHSSVRPAACEDVHELARRVYAWSRHTDRSARRGLRHHPMDVLTASGRRPGGERRSRLRGCAIRPRASHSRRWCRRARAGPATRGSTPRGKRRSRGSTTPDGRSPATPA